MGREYTSEELDSLSTNELKTIILTMQGQVAQLNENMEHLIEQIRLSNQRLYGRKTETMDQIAGQLSIFDESEALSDPSLEEPSPEDVIRTSPRRPVRKKGKRDTDLAGLTEEVIEHGLTDEALDAFFGAGCWRRREDESYKRLRYVPQSWVVEVHKVQVAVGTDGEHQDEFLRGRRSSDLLRNSIVTPSLAGAILNGKYVLALPYYRIEQEFQRNGIYISRQTMANWVISLSRKYFSPLCERLKKELLSCHVNQADETPTLVLKDERETVSNSFMWVHRTGEFNTERPVILYEYQKTRRSDHPLEYYKDFNGVLVTDGLQQYHTLAKKLKQVTNANCWTHARRFFADAIKAAGKKDSAAVRNSVAYRALILIGQIFDQEGRLKQLDPEERLRERRKKIAPLVEAYFAWAKQQLADGTVPPKSETAKGLNYSINQEEYLRVFLTDGEVPIDNSASERSIRPFCLGKKNWLFFNTIKGAEAGAMVYSIAETAKANHLNTYQYFKYLLEELPKLADEKDDIDPDSLDHLLPWSKTIPKECISKRH